MGKIWGKYGENPLSMETIVAGTIIEIYRNHRADWIFNCHIWPAGLSSLPAGVLRCQRVAGFFRVSWRWKASSVCREKPRSKELQEAMLASSSRDLVQNHKGKLPLTPFATCINCSNDIFLQSHEIHVLQCWSKRSKWSPSAALLQTTNGRVAQDDVHLALGFSL